MRGFYRVIKGQREQIEGQTPRSRQTAPARPSGRMASGSLWRRLRHHHSECDFAGAAMVRRRRRLETGFPCDRSALRLSAWNFSEYAGFILHASNSAVGPRKGENHRLALLILTSALTIPVLAQAANIDWEKVDAALAKTAAISGDVHRYELPRSDLTVTLDHHAIASTDSPPLASRMRFTTGTGLVRPLPAAIAARRCRTPCLSPARTAA